MHDPKKIKALYSYSDFLILYSLQHNGLNPFIPILTILTIDSGGKWETVIVQKCVVITDNCLDFLCSEICPNQCGNKQTT